MAEVSHQGGYIRKYPGIDLLQDKFGNSMFQQQVSIMDQPLPEFANAVILSRELEIFL